jgi:hypothetical protein
MLLMSRQIKLEDELVSTRTISEVLRKINSPELNAVQLALETRIWDYRLEDCFQPYGTLIDALGYLQNKKQSMPNLYESEKAQLRIGSNKEKNEIYLIKISNMLENAFKCISDKYEIRPDAMQKHQGDILERYKSFCSIYFELNEIEKTRWICHPYGLLWIPWFKNLREKCRTEISEVFYRMAEPKFRLMISGPIETPFE